MLLLLNSKASMRSFHLTIFADGWLSKIKSSTLALCSLFYCIGSFQQQQIHISIIITKCLCIQNTKLRTIERFLSNLLALKKGINTNTNLISQS